MVLLGCHVGWLGGCLERGFGMVHVRLRRKSCVGCVCIR